MYTEYKATESRSSILKYWTRERCASAKPRRRVRGRPISTQAPTALPGYDPRAPRVPEKNLGASKVPDPTVFPWCAVGALFFVSGGEDWVGTAFVIAESGIMTAAHNLFDPDDGYSTKVEFVPAYENGQAPFGRWAYSDYWVPDEYKKDADDDAYDLGLVALEEDPDTQSSVADLVGQIQVQTNFPLNEPRTFHEVGYPDEFMWQSSGAYTRSLDKGGIIGKEGELPKGASGGPWLIGSPIGVANGLTSHSDPRYPGEEFSPYFGQWVEEFIEAHFGSGVGLAKAV